jgi:hypothetical protein
MSRTEGKPYDVGYGRPPQRTRWKKGQSGNPRHKEGKVREGTVAILDRLLTRVVPIKINGKLNRMSALEVIINQLVQQELAGSVRASRVLLKYMQLANSTSEKKIELRFVEDDYTRAFSTRPIDADNHHE